MVIETEGKTNFQQPDTKIIDSESIHEIIFKKICSELYPIGLNPIEPVYGRACELIGDLDGVEARMIADQVFTVDGRFKKDPQRLADEQRERDEALASELSALSQVTVPLKRRPRIHHHR